MAETDDDPVASWHDRVDTMRKRGRVSAAALAVVPTEDIASAVAARPPLSGCPRRSAHCGTS